MSRWSLLLLLILGVCGCGEAPAASGGDPQLPTRDFSIGSPRQYSKPGVYDRLRRSHRVWIVSDEQMITVLDAGCPHDGAVTYYDTLTTQFHCSRCSARFSQFGLPLAGRPDSLALVRLRVALRGERDAPDAELWVNPRVTYRFEKNEWSARHSLWTFAPVE